MVAFPQKHPLATSQKSPWPPGRHPWSIPALPPGYPTAPWQRPALALLLPLPTQAKSQLWHQEDPTAPWTSLARIPAVPNPRFSLLAPARLWPPRGKPFLRNRKPLLPGDLPASAPCYPRAPSAENSTGPAPASTNPLRNLVLALRGPHSLLDLPGTEPCSPKPQVFLAGPCKALAS